VDIVQNARPVRYIKAYEPWRTIFFADPVAIPLARLLAALRVNPNVITVLSIVCGIVPGVLFAMGYWVWAALLFEFRFLLDCVDGKVARLRGVTSELGARMDAFGELPGKPSCFIGIGVYFYWNSHPWLAALTAAAVAAHYGIHKLFALFGISPYDLEFPQFHRTWVRRIVPRSVNLYSWFDEEFLEFTVFPLIGGLVGLPAGGIWFFYGAGLVMVLGLVKMAISLNHRQKGRYPQIYQDWSGTKGNLDSSPATPAKQTALAAKWTVGHA
jgi:phosphatidylglycerophosphate synthase